MMMWKGIMLDWLVDSGRSFEGRSLGPGAWSLQEMTVPWRHLLTLLSMTRAWTWAWRRTPWRAATGTAPPASPGTSRER